MIDTTSGIHCKKEKWDDEKVNKKQFLAEYVQRIYIRKEKKKDLNAITLPKLQMHESLHVSIMHASFPSVDCFSKKSKRSLKMAADRRCQEEAKMEKKGPLFVRVCLWDRVELSQKSMQMPTFP